MRVRQLMGRAPSSWSAEEVDRSRRFVAANASLLAACERAAERRERRGTAFDGGAALPWESADINQLWRRAHNQSILLRTRIGLGLRERSPGEVRRGMEALAAEVEAYAAEPGMLFQLYELPLEKSLLRAMAWVAAERDIDSGDLAAMRQLLHRRPVAATIRRAFAGEAGYLLAIEGRRGYQRLSDADAAEVLDGYRRLALALARMTGTRGAAGAAGVRESPHAARYPTMARAILALVRPNFEEVAKQIAATAAARQLAELAFDLRLAGRRECAYPETLEGVPRAGEPDPFTARLPSYRRGAVGGALLANPSAAAAWQALPRCATSLPLPFEWRLPPPCAAAAM
ncbi:MAG TPA: hypothetical protein VHR45_18500 [Thermoanaerobaculia bacterium]|nr:hypothetical protein [Thermoanaerobaculia bacterium]